MARDNAVSVIDQDGIGKTKPPDRIGDLGNLLLRVRAGIGWARLQGAYILVNNRKPSVVWFCWRHFDLHG